MILSSYLLSLAFCCRQLLWSSPFLLLLFLLALFMALYVILAERLTGSLHLCLLLCALQWDHFLITVTFTIYIMLDFIWIMAVRDAIPRLHFLIRWVHRKAKRILLVMCSCTATSMCAKRRDANARRFLVLLHMYFSDLKTQMTIISRHLHSMAKSYVK